MRNGKSIYHEGLLWIFIGIFTLVVIASSISEGIDKIRVVVFKGNKVDIFLIDPLIIDMDRNEIIASKDGFFSARFNISNGKMFFNGKELGSRSILITSPKSFIVMNKKAFRGNLELYGGQEIIVVNVLSLDDYLVGLINMEISSKWHMEVLKAQAVVARTYALYRKEMKKEELYHLESSVMDQVYEGGNVEDVASAIAVFSTKGEILVNDGKILPAFYHSTCGGHTESSKEVWGFYHPSLKGVKCDFCIDSPNYSWVYKISLGDLENLTGIKGIVGIDIVERTSTGRVKKLIIRTGNSNHRISGSALRKTVGYENLKSTNFSVSFNRGDIIFKGKGSGHGVGLCQWGAKKMAEMGYNYREILQFYYPGSRIEVLDEKGE